MKEALHVAARVALFTLVATGLVYPAVVTVLAQQIFPERAGGSLVSDNRGHVVGSELIGQTMSDAAYFQPRPSAAGAGYDGLASGGSNLGPTSNALRQRVAKELTRLQRDNPDADARVPADLVTASASGLDPDISPEAAVWQVARIARQRGVAGERITGIVANYLQQRTFGFLGEPRVNVLLLNMALDMHFGAPSQGVRR